MSNLTAQELIYKSMVHECYKREDNFNFTDYSEYITYEDLWYELRERSTIVVMKLSLNFEKGLKQIFHLKQVLVIMKLKFVQSKLMVFGSLGTSTMVVENMENLKLLIGSVMHVL